MQPHPEWEAAELRAYLKSKGAEISEENSEGGLHVDLAQIIEACDVCLKEDDKDVESVMNSVVSLLLILEPDKQEALIESLCEKLVKFREGERPSLRLQFDAASKVMVELLGSYTEDNASQARVDAHRCIVRALKDPNAFLFDHLLTLKPVKFLEGELIHDLLTIFVSAKLASYVKFYQNNKDFIDSLVRTKMVYCKIDQTQRKVVVSHSTHRTFGKQQWQQLYDTLNAWKQNLNKVKNSLLSLSDT
ncbi:hypothetical protein GH733_007349 [Mirounga leonina]|nr:hypothetical protein GH733_007349 [Mirounga leonina]